ncbi:hypothetical protein KAI04_02850 [Candidatus Pacearchaeota archaeon]|nr:hypothetical protein [Candidatus Pacearchaeota archaeon]
MEENNKISGYSEEHPFKIYAKLIKLNKQVERISLGELKLYETHKLLVKTRIQIETYKAKVPNILKEEFNFDIKSLEKYVLHAEESIKILNNKSK